MKIIISKVLIFTLTTVLNVQAQKIPSVSTGTGTLIVAVPTRDGLIVCADKRVHFKQGNGIGNTVTEYNDDSIVKVRQLGKHVMFAIAGLTRFKEGSPKISFVPTTNTSILGSTTSLTSLTSSTLRLQIIDSETNLHRVIQDYYKYHDLDKIENSWNGLGWELKSKIAPIEKKASNEDLFFQIPVFYLDSAGHLKGRLFQRVLYSQTMTYEVYSEPYSDSTFTIAKPLLFGSPELFEELRKDQNDDFNHLRDEPVLLPFLSEPWSVRDVSKQMAIKFAKTLIEATHRFGKRLKPNTEVSLECDCMILEPGVGAREITQSDEAVTLQEDVNQKPKKKK